jgi:hypothetical protein
MEKEFEIVGCAIGECGGLCSECGNMFGDEGCNLASKVTNFYYLYKETQ